MARIKSHKLVNVWWRCIIDDYRFGGSLNVAKPRRCFRCELLGAHASSNVHKTSLITNELVSMFNFATQVIKFETEI